MPAPAMGPWFMPMLKPYHPDAEQSPRVDLAVSVGHLSRLSVRW